MNNLGKQVAAFRAARGLTTSDLAREVGTSRQNIEHLEKSDRQYLPHFLAKLANVMGEHLDLGFSSGLLYEQPKSTDHHTSGYRKGVLDALEKLIDAGIVTAPGLLNALTASAPATPSKERLDAAVASYGGVLAFCEAFGFSVDSLFLWPAGTQAKRVNAAVFACEAKL